MGVQLHLTTEFHNITWDKLNLKGYFMDILPPFLHVIQSIHWLAVFDSSNPHYHTSFGILIKESMAKSIRQRK